LFVSYPVLEDAKPFLDLDTDLGLKNPGSQLLSSKDVVLVANKVDLLKISNNFKGISILLFGTLPYSFQEI